MELTQLRQEIDLVDEELVRLFKQRMWLSSQIGAYKKEKGLPVCVPQREQEKMEVLKKRVMPEMEPYLESFYETIFALSRNYQEETP